jgi:hypothetical protein
VGIDYPDIEVIDLAHPLLRRLIDLTLDRAQIPDCQGRVAARTTTAQVGHGIALHVLFRYVANAQPPVLLEEIVPLGYRTSDDAAFDAEAALAAPAGYGTRHRGEVLDDATEILHAPELRDRLARVAQQRSDQLAQRYAQLSAPWAHGLDRVEPTSLDLVALTIIYPEVAR